MMKPAVVAASPDEYVAALQGWRRTLVVALRAAVRAAGVRDERIKWGHIVAFSSGPLVLIRAEDERVLFGFWRGKRLLELEPRLVGGGKFELRTLVLREGEALAPAAARRLVREAVKLNATLGDPTRRAAPATKRAAPAKQRAAPAKQRAAPATQRPAPTTQRAAPAAAAGVTAPRGRR